ncbi:MAG TPA: MYXO-CTERM sorting domain-containing protein, partial [Polyangia bacterium]|nr:MYXO-CTERM sorting domain-containing protein [Polyangia bacterium]
LVNVFQPGQPVSVTVTSTVDHPGWWRISLREGRASTQTSSVFPDPTPLGAANTAQQCTPAFIDNPVWSPTQPVLADKLGLPSGSVQTDFFQRGTQTFSVTIPATAHCTSANPCTLQVLMIMTDHTFIGGCNYHHCADMAAASDGGVLDAGGGVDVRPGTDGASGGTGGRAGTGGGNGTAGSTGASGTGGSNGTAGAAGGVGGTTGGAGVGGSSGGDAGNVMPPTDGGCGCAVGAGMGGWTAAPLLIVGLLLLRRRRRG